MSLPNARPKLAGRCGKDLIAEQDKRRPIHRISGPFVLQEPSLARQGRFPSGRDPTVDSPLGIPDLSGSFVLCRWANCRGRDQAILRSTKTGLILGNMTADADFWFVQEVLPLEAALVRYLRRNWRDDSEIADLRQEVYARVYEKALTGIPAQAKPFVFMTARNLIIDRIRRLRVVSIEAVADIETLNVTADDLTPERIALAREELRRLQAALELLPPRCREVVGLRKIEGLSQREVGMRLGIAEDTVEHHLAKGMRALADAIFGRVPASESAAVVPPMVEAEER